jgi:phage gpG-like protein
MVTVELFKTPESNAEQALERLRRRMPDIDRRLRLIFAGQIVGEVQKNYLRGQVLHRKSGDLAASIAYRDTSAHETMIGSYGIIYARIHELGGTIVPRYKKWLRFKTDTGWVMTKKVHMPKRPYLLPGIVDYFSGGMAGRTAETVLQRELDRVEKS